MKTVLLIAMTVLLTGCFGNEKVNDFRDDWVADCSIVPPPDGDTYVTATEEERNVMWTEVYIKQVNVNANCNVRLRAASAYIKAVKEGKEPNP